MSTRLEATRHEVRALFALAWPIVLTQLALMLMGTVDFMMVGRSGVAEVGAVMLGNVWKIGTVLVVESASMSVCCNYSLNIPCRVWHRRSNNCVAPKVRTPTESFAVYRRRQLGNRNHLARNWTVWFATT